MRIETARLVLREFVEEDWRAVRAYQSDPRYLRYTDWTERGEADARAFVGMFLAQQTEVPRRKFQLALTLRSNGLLIGNCGIRVNDPDLGEANIGYELDPTHWGQGYATEAARAILAFGFTDLGLHRVWAECVAENTGSRRCVEKLDAPRGPFSRALADARPLWWDTLTYAILADEWAAGDR